MNEGEDRYSGVREVRIGMNEGEDRYSGVREVRCTVGRGIKWVVGRVVGCQGSSCQDVLGCSSGLNVVEW
jgi:hypothetical protein